MGEDGRDNLKDHGVSYVFNDYLFFVYLSDFWVVIFTINLRITILVYSNLELYMMERVLSDVLTSVLTDLLTYILNDLRAYLPTTYLLRYYFVF